MKNTEWLGLILAFIVTVLGIEGAATFIKLEIADESFWPHIVTFLFSFLWIFAALWLWVVAIPETIRKKRLEKDKSANSTERVQRDGPWYELNSESGIAVDLSRQDLVLIRRQGDKILVSLAKKESE